MAWGCNRSAHSEAQKLSGPLGLSGCLRSIPSSLQQRVSKACHLNFAPKERVRIREEDNTMLPIYPNFRPHHGRNEGGSPAMFECKLVASKRQTAFGPLCLLGHYLSQEGVLKPLSSVHIVQKSIKPSPTQNSSTPSWASSRVVKLSTRSMSGCAPMRRSKEPSAGSVVPINPPSRGP